MKKIILVLVMIVSTLFVKPLNGDINNTQDNITQNNTIATQSKIFENEIKDNLNEVNEIDVRPKDEEKNTNEDSLLGENKEIDDNEPIKENKTSKNENKSSNKNNEKQIQKEQKIVEKVPEPIKESKQEEKKVEQPKTQEKQVENVKPKQEEKIYCVDGGKVHIYGDGANEHGYYKTWDEAFKAYEDYTKGWESTQFKVDQCACGLYYFWVIK